MLLATWPTGNHVMVFPPSREYPTTLTRLRSLAAMAKDGAVGPTIIPAAILCPLSTILWKVGPVASLRTHHSALHALWPRASTAQKVTLCMPSGKMNHADASMGTVNTPGNALVI